ncbi:TetR family transcriptional regulator [Aeromicrobium sp. CF4.19]|uniref:TetR/AcrR family transcriptional regulator n=1 Tax=Aeromicrobium sp. CF4.19 TaxID=3373082 RepID=UPI003EE58A71
MAQERRGRGRPVAVDGVDRRTALLDAAREQFAAKGYAQASLRSIAAQAGVDASLVNHYFGDKQGLFIETLELPVNPLLRIRGVLDQGTEGLGERLVRTFLSSWDPHPAVFAAIVRTGLVESPEATGPVLEMVRTVLRDQLADVLDGDDAELRASLVVSQVLGLGVARYVMQVEPLASAVVEDVAVRHGSAIQALVDD